MLIELWEKLRGYDKWVESEGKVVAASVEKGELTSKVVCRIAWKDRMGKEHETRLDADEESPLFQLSEEDTVKIRFNPARPGEVYIPGLIESDALALRKTILLGIMFVLAAIAFFFPDIVVLFSRK